MQRIGLISDTHGHLDQDIMEALSSVDEIWHAGDVGDVSVIDALEDLKPCRGVFGNIDGRDVRLRWPEKQLFCLGALKVFMTHIGGYPPRYTIDVKETLRRERPHLYVCGHSHILKVMPDRSLELLHMNPGACGHHGFHKVRTMLRFSIDLQSAKVSELEVVEFGMRGRVR